MSEVDDAISHTLSEVLEGRQELSEATREVFVGVWKDAYPKARAMAFRITQDAETAEELAQEALLTAMRKRREFEGRAGARWSTWVTGIARNLALNRVRRKEAILDEEIVAAWDGADPQQQRPQTVLQQLSQAERIELVRRVSAEVLTPREQQVADYRYLENIDRYAIIGDLLEPPASAEEIRATLVRMKRHLLPALRRELEQLGHGMSFIRTDDIE